MKLSENERLVERTRDAIRDALVRSGANESYAAADANAIVRPVLDALEGEVVERDALERAASSLTASAEEHECRSCEKAAAGARSLLPDKEAEDG